MGVDIALYRVRIGLFNIFKSVSKTVCVMSSVIAVTSTYSILFMLLQTLLCLSGDVELNPGPHLSRFHFGIVMLEDQTQKKYKLYQRMSQRFTIYSLYAKLS